MRGVPDVWVKLFPLRKWHVQGAGKEAWFFTTAKLMQMLEGK